jgi:hypothetical protein
MSEVKTGQKSDWLIFLVSLVAMIVLLIVATPWFWVALPFVLTYLVKAIGVM